MSDHGQVKELSKFIVKAIITIEKTFLPSKLELGCLQFGPISLLEPLPIKPSQRCRTSVSVWRKTGAGSCVGSLKCILSDNKLNLTEGRYT